MSSVFYKWADKPIGYSRIIPDDDWPNARASIRKAVNRHSMAFDVTTYMACRKVTVTLPATIPPIKQCPDLAHYGYDPDTHG